MSVRPALAALTVFAALGSDGQPVGAQEVLPALTRAEEAYERISSLRAEFVQTIVNPMLGGPEESRGVLYLEPPGRFAMRFEDPSGDRIVVDGTWLWTYAPSSVPNQVIKQPVPAGGTSTPNLLAQFVERPLERYDASGVGVDTIHGQVVDLVRLDPKADDTGFTEAVIAVGRRDGLLWRIALREETGQRRTLIFERIRTDLPIPDGEFSFVPPRGTRVVTP
jgi:outer membrane lipoprotein carrier protein